MPPRPLPPDLQRAARAGTAALRSLLTPPLPDPDAAWSLDAPDAVPDPRQLLRRGANMTRRGLGLVTLLLLSGLGAALLLVLVIFLGVGLANGHIWAGVLLFLLVLVALFAGWWVYRRASELLGMAAPAGAENPAPDDETRLLELWQSNRAAVPQALLPALRATMLATRDALRATSQEAAGGTFTLSRDLYDARQTARADLPELLAAYRAVPPSAQSDVQLLEHLRIIEGRMQQILTRQREVQQRDLTAQGAYLRDKYDPAAPESPEPVEPLPEPERVPVRQRR